MVCIHLYTWKNEYRWKCSFCLNEENKNSPSGQLVKQGAAAQNLFWNAANWNRSGFLHTLMLPLKCWTQTATITAEFMSVLRKQTARILFSISYWWLLFQLVTHTGKRQQSRPVGNFFFFKLKIYWKEIWSHIFSAI